MKICTKCNQEKAEDQFTFKDKTHTSRRSMCKECAREYERQRRQKVKSNNHEMHIILTQDQWEMLQQKAADCNKSVNKYVVDMLTKSKVVKVKERHNYNEVKEVLIEFRKEINSMGININQIAHQLNTYYPNNETINKFARNLTDNMKATIRKVKTIEREVSKWR